MILRLRAAMAALCSGLPHHEALRVMQPNTSVTSPVMAASSSRVRSAASTKISRSSRSRGGYPVTASSGTSTTSAPAPTPSAYARRINSAFAASAPTAGKSPGYEQVLRLCRAGGETPPSQPAGRQRSVALARMQRLVRRSRDLQLFVGRDHPHPHPPRADAAFVGARGAVGGVVEDHVEEAEAVTDTLAHRGGVLADSCGEGDCVDAVQRRAV